jgi:hypothetical protein
VSGAREKGLEDQEIMEAIEVGKTIRAGSALAYDLLSLN